MSQMYTMLFGGIEYTSETLSEICSLLSTQRQPFAIACYAQGPFYACLRRCICPCIGWYRQQLSYYTCSLLLSRSDAFNILTSTTYL